MKETLKHKEAFEYYYSLGDKRGYAEVARECTVGRSAVARWGVAFNWQERVSLRDVENAKPLQEQTDKAVVDRKAKRLAEVQKHIDELPILRGFIIKSLANSKDAIESGALKAKDTKELGDLFRSLGSITKDGIELQKLEQLLLGEDTERDGGQITYISNLSRPGKSKNGDSD